MGLLNISKLGLNMLNHWNIREYRKYHMLTCIIISYNDCMKVQWIKIIIQNVSENSFQEYIT